jgi:aryl sulfotransferase
VDALVFSPRAKYLYLGRDGRDTVWSRYNHHANMTAAFYSVVNDTPGRVGPAIEPPPASIHAYYRQFFENDGFPYWPFWENVRSWWAIRNLPNVKLVHFNDLKRDLPGSIRSIAAFLSVPIDERSLPAIVEHCSFDYMKANTAKVSPGGFTWLEGGATTFINLGTNGRWKDVLTPAESVEYEARAVAELGEECAAWLVNGAKSASTPGAPTG